MPVFNRPRSLGGQLAAQLADLDRRLRVLETRPNLAAATRAVSPDGPSADPSNPPDGDPDTDTQDGVR